MGLANEKITIEQYFENEWNSRTPLDFENTKFAQPKNESWVRLTILTGESEYRAINKEKMHIGVITVQIFTPENKATGIAMDYADDVIGIFETDDIEVVQEDTTIRFSVSSTIMLGLDSTFYQTNVSIPFSVND